MTSELIPAERIETKILLLRDQKVMLDRDLAALYGVPTKVLKQAFRRNAERFPNDFAFVLDNQEVAILRSQFVTSCPDHGPSMRSQFVTASKRNIRYRPWAFMEHFA